MLSIVNVHHGISYDQIAIKGYNSITSSSGIVAIGLMPHSKWLLTVGSNFDIDDSNSSSKKFGKLWINSVAFVRPQTILCGAVESNPYSVTTISLGLQEIISERLAVRLSFRDNPMS